MPRSSRGTTVAGLERNISMYQLRKITRSVVREYFYGGGSRLASSLAYSSLLAIVPLMLVSLSLVSKVPAFSHMVSTLQAFILKNFVAEAASSVSVYVSAFLTQLGNLTIANMGAFLITVLLLLYNMVAAFNQIWRVEMHFKLEFTLSFLYYFVVLLLAPLVLIITMLLVSSVLSLSLFANDYFQTLVIHPFLQVVPYAAVFIMFTFLNWVLPTCRVRWRYACLSGFVSMVLFECAKYLFTFYMRLFPSMRIIYGALATIPIFFIWIYVSWVITLLGAILCKTLQQDKDVRLIR
jgi:membrane protein